MRLLLAILAISLTACASDKIIRDELYQPAVEAYGRAEPDEAQRRFPEGEDRGFITSTEKAWLGLWSGEGSDHDLARQAPSFDDRHFVSLTREAGVFLFQESEEGYVPAEHEAVVFHLVRAIYFHRQKNKRTRRSNFGSLDIFSIAHGTIRLFGFGSALFGPPMAIGLRPKWIFAGRMNLRRTIQSPT